MATSLQTSRRFVGLDTYKIPGDLTGEYLTQADNVFIEGGELVVRPGKQGQLLAPLGIPAYAPFPYVKADGTTTTTFSAAGKLFQLPKGGNAPVEIFNQTPAGQASFALNSAACFAERLGQYEYRVDGAGPLVRHSLTTGGVVSSLNNPTAAPLAVLTNKPLDLMNNPANWTVDTQVTGTGNRIADGDFSASGGNNSAGGTGGGGGTANFGPWIPIGQNPDFYGDGETYTVKSPYDVSGTGRWLLCDSPGDGVQSPPILNDTITGTTRTCGQFYVRTGYVQGDATGRPGIRLAVNVYGTTDGSGPVLSTQFQDFFPQYASQSILQFIDAVFSFPDVSTPILSYTASVSSTPFNNVLGDKSTYVKYIVSYPLVPALTLSASQAGGLAVSMAQPTSGFYGAVGTGRLNHDFGANQDLTLHNVLTVQLGNASDLVTAGLKLRFGVRADGSAIEYSTNALTISADGTYATIDISTLSTAIRQTVRYLAIIFDADLEVSAPRSPVITIGPLSAAGNLSYGYADVSYLYEEVNENGDTTLINVIESGGSPTSGAITPTLQKATGLVTLPAPINSGSGSNPGAARFNLYRYGGVYSDGYARFVCSYRYDGSEGNEAASPFVSYNAATKTVTDDTPDSYLFNANTYITGRVPPPVGAQAITSWQGRLWLAKGSTLYASWLQAAGQQDALYFTAVNILDDPQAAIKGAQFSLGAADNDPIQALIPYGTTLIVLKQRSVWMVFGYDPSNFAAQSYLLRAGVGCLAPRAACVVGNHVWFLSADGVYSFNADIVDPKSIELTKFLNPHGDDGSETISPAAYANAAMVYYNRRLLLFAPTPGDTTNTAAYVWDSRTMGWTRYLEMNVTSGASLHGGTDGLDLIMTGYDGQLYMLAGAGDLAAPGGTLTAIPWTVKTRGMGQESEDIGFWREDQAKYVYFFLTTAAQSTTAVRVEGDNPALAWTKNYQCSPGATSPRMRVNSRVRGNLLFVTLSGAALSHTALRSVALTANEGPIQQ